MAGGGARKVDWTLHLPLESSVKTVTIDTNILPATDLVDLAKSKGYEVATVSVTEREVGQDDIRLRVPDLSQIMETGLWGESEWGRFKWGGNASYLESILQIITNGSFPKSGKRGQITDAQHRQLRDAIILETHVRDGREIFVTDDRKGFIDNGRRDALQSLLKTRILTREEFLQELQG